MSLRTTVISSIRKAGERSRALSVPLRRARANRTLARFAKPYKLNLGCGRVRFEGWINLDSNRHLDTVDLLWDLRDGIPTEDGTCELIYCEHMLEHLSAADGLAFLRECRRALMPNGTVRIAMPSLDFILERATSDNWRDQDWLSWPRYRTIQTRAEMLNVAFRDWGHQYLYDREELRRRLLEAGFATIEDHERGKSAHSELVDRETRVDSILVCEARV